jgi:hypothetical protein
MEPGRWNLVVASYYSTGQCFNGADSEAIKGQFTEIEIARENKILIEAMKLTPP